MALCSGLLGFSLLDRLSGSWVMPSVCVGAWLWGDVEISTDPSIIERVKERSREQQRVESKIGRKKNVNNYICGGTLFLITVLCLYPLVCVSGAG